MLDHNIDTCVAYFVRKEVNRYVQQLACMVFFLQDAFLSHEGMEMFFHIWGIRDLTVPNGSLLSRTV